MSTVPYSTITKVQKRLSTGAVEDRTDDDSDAINDCLLNATLDVQGYLLGLYSDNALRASEWVTLRTTDIALWYLCARRGNPVPGPIQACYDRAIADLVRFSKGTPQIPNTPMLRSTAPVVTNQRVSLWPFPHIVNIPSQSTSKREGYTSNDDRTDIDPR